MSRIQVGQNVGIVTVSTTGFNQDRTETVTFRSTVVVYAVAGDPTSRA